MSDTLAAAPCTPLVDEESPLSAMLDAVTDGLMVVDQGWCITWMNPVTERLARGAGKKDSTVGQVLWSVFPDLENTPFGLAYRRAMSAQMAVSVEAYYPTLDAWYEARAFPSQQGLLISFRDVSERVRSQEAAQRALSSEARARAHAEHAAELIALLQALTARLSSAITPEEVVEVVAGAAMRAVGADTAVVALPKDGRLHTAAYRGIAPERLERYRTVDVDAPFPLAVAFRTREPAWLRSVEHLVAQYPGLAEELRADRFEGAMACLPLTVRGAALGALALTFKEPRSFPPEERAFVESIAHQCALALDRAQIYAREHEARAAAEAGEQRFRAILQSPMMGLILTDFDGRVLEANDAFLRMVGHERAELHRGGLDWRRLTPPEYAQANADALADLRGRGYVAPFEKRYFRKDGSQVPVLVASTRIEEQNVNATFVLDISERNRMLEQAQSSARRSQFLADASRILAESLDYRKTLDSIVKLAVPGLADWCAVDMVAPDGQLERLAVAHPDPAKVELVTEIAERYPPDPNAPHGLHAVLRSGRPEWMQLIPDVLLERLAQDEEHLEVIRELGLRSYICVPIKARGVVLGALSLVYAESGRLYDEEDYQLAQEVARQASLAVDNARLYAEAQEAIRLRDEFLSVASHELKTPLTPLNLRLQGLTRDVQAQKHDRVEEHVEIARRQVKKLSSLVDGLLDVSRISAGKLHLEPDEVDLGEVAREVVHGHEQEAARVGSELQLQAGAPVLGHWDRLRLEQVVTNLVSNAIKYGAGRPIRVKVCTHAGRARLEVHDEGIGISSTDAPRIFERFERAVSGRNYGGLGLGLYISRRIVEAHGGTIQLASRPGDGSTFVVSLPL